MAKIVTIFNSNDYSYDDEDLRDGAIEQLEANNLSVTDESIRETIDDLENDDFHDAIQEIKTFFHDKLVLMVGTCGTWRGDMPGGLIGTFEDLFYKACKDCSIFNIYDEAGHLHLELSHHDGTNRFEVYMLSDKGNEYVERHGLSFVEHNEEVHERFLNNRNYIRLPRFAKKVYGR